MSVARLSRRSFVKSAVLGAAGTLLRELTAFAESPSGKARGTANLSTLTLAAASELVRAKKVSPVELTKTCLARIEQLNPKLNAFILITGDSALAEARAAETEINRGRWKGPLHGVPIALKDLVDTACVRTTAASNLFKDRVPAQDADVVRRLKMAGAVVLGKHNMHEFAYGGSSVISAFGPVRNPWGTDYSTGGVSRGAAAALAAGLSSVARAPDARGCVRPPP